MSYHRGIVWAGTPIGRLGRLMREITAGLEVLRRVQFEKPWDARRRGRH